MVEGTKVFRLVGASIELRDVELWIIAIGVSPKRVDEDVTVFIMERGPRASGVKTRIGDEWLRGVKLAEDPVGGKGIRGTIR